MQVNLGTRPLNARSLPCLAVVAAIGERSFVSLPAARPPPTLANVAPQAPFHCDVRASFACAFTAWRQQHRIPRKQIARDLGVAVSTVSAWEWGERFPTGANFERLVEYTGPPPCKLFCLMADKCVPADCLLAMRRVTSSRA